MSSTPEQAPDCSQQDSMGGSSMTCCMRCSYAPVLPSITCSSTGGSWQLTRTPHCSCTSAAQAAPHL